MSPINENRIREIIQEVLENWQDLDRENVSVEQVREIFREELPAALKKSTFRIEGNIQLLDGRNIILGSSSGTKIGTATTQKMGFFNKTPATQPTNGANLTNNAASGGTDDTIANYTDLATYANDAAAIRNNIYQLAKKLKVVNDALRIIGLMS